MKIVQAILVYIAFAFSMTAIAEASIVNDPIALAAKLEQMQEVREAKHAAREAYWADYRALPEIQVREQVCSKVYSTKGVYRKCSMETRWEKDTSNFHQVQPSISIRAEDLQ